MQAKNTLITPKLNERERITIGTKSQAAISDDGTELVGQGTVQIVK